MKSVKKWQQSFGTKVTAMYGTFCFHDPRFQTRQNSKFQCNVAVLEARLWLEIARLVRARWERRDHNAPTVAPYEVETLWSNEDVQSIEVRNYVY